MKSAVSMTDPWDVVFLMTLVLAGTGWRNWLACEFELSVKLNQYPAPVLCVSLFQKKDYAFLNVY